MHPSVLVLIITGILGVLGIGIIIAAVFFSENKENQGMTGITGITGQTGFTGTTGICVGPGIAPLIGPPSYTRHSPKSTCSTPLSTQTPTFTSVSHSVQRSYRLRTITEPISPNHWLGNAMYNDTNTFLVYPYYGSITAEGLQFGWPGTGVITENCAASTTSTCPTGFADLSFDVAWGPTIKLGNLASPALSCDIVDVDALVANIIWQYRDRATSGTGSISIPLAKGCPFITAEVYKTGLTLECNFPVNLSMVTSMIYQLSIDADTGYLLFLDKARPVHSYDHIVYLTTFTGVIRIAYYQTPEMIDLYTQNHVVYPTESTIGTTAMMSSDSKSWNVDTTFSWTTGTMYDTCTDTRLLMAALPYHNIVNLYSESFLLSHPVIGRFRLVTTTNNRDEWILADAIANYPITYPSVGSDSEKSLFITTWQNEIMNIDSSAPAETVNWCKWIGSLAILILIGNMLNQDISKPLTDLMNQLSLMTNGMISSSNRLVYDKTWGGIIGQMGLSDCSGQTDEGNAFYTSHINQYGYLIFAYAVAGHYHPDFIASNRETILYFVRTVANPCSSDSSFPLWRHKDWYLGYSLSSGLAPNQSRGKDTSNIGEAILGYYGTYLLSTMIPNSSDLTMWSLGLLASELISLQYYFTFVAQSAIEVNFNFVQGTITNRGDTYYAYTVMGGNPFFPPRNASIMVPVLKPMNLMSFDYISLKWCNFVYQWMTYALQNGISTVEPESLATALGILGTQNTAPYTRSYIVQTITDQSTVYLPYGSTWSSFMYWVLAQST